MDHADIDHTGLTGIGSGAVTTDTIWDAAGDLAVGTGANTAAKLTVGASGTVPRSNGTTLAYAFPPGYELLYAEKTSDTNVTATAAASADTILDSGSFTADGTAIIVTVSGSGVTLPATSAIELRLTLWEASTDLGVLEIFRNNAAATNRMPVGTRQYRVTPASGSRNYILKGVMSASGTGVVLAGSGGTALQNLPLSIRITKA